MVVSVEKSESKGKDVDGPKPVKWSIDCIDECRYIWGMHFIAGRPTYKFTSV